VESESERVRKCLLTQCKHRATRKKITKYLGHKPNWNELFGSGVIRAVHGCPNHVELVS